LNLAIKSTDSIGMSNVFGLLTLSSKRSFCSLKLIFNGLTLISSMVGFCGLVITLAHAPNTMTKATAMANKQKRRLRNLFISEDSEAVSFATGVSIAC